MHSSFVKCNKFFFFFLIVIQVKTCMRQNCLKFQTPVVKSHTHTHARTHAPTHTHPQQATRRRNSLALNVFTNMYTHTKTQNTNEWKNNNEIYKSKTAQHNLFIFNLVCFDFFPWTLAVVSVFSFTFSSTFEICYSSVTSSPTTPDWS